MIRNKTIYVGNGSKPFREMFVKFHVIFANSVGAGVLDRPNELYGN